MRDRATSTHRSRLTPSGHKPERNPAAQQDPDSICPNPLCCCLAGQRMQFDRLRRREFVTLLGGAAVWPIAAHAQQPAKMLRVGTVAGNPKSEPQWIAFERRMGELGYREGKNFSFDFVQAASADEYEVL